MWRGSVVGDHPLVNGSQNTNWYICNGNNSTPDLRDRFIVGVGSDYGNAKGVTGGSNTNSIHMMLILMTLLLVRTLTIILQMQILVTFLVLTLQGVPLPRLGKVIHTEVVLILIVII